MELGLFQRDLRARFKLEKETYANWEKGRCYPAMRHWPDILSFLGYDPTLKPQTFGQQLIAYRRRSGMSRKDLAILLRVDETTLWRWETDERKPNSDRHVKIVRRLELI